MIYTAIVTKEGKQTLAEFPDCPGCQTFADEGEDLEDRAEEALVGWLEAMMKLGRVPAAPSTIRQRHGVALIQVPVPTRLAMAIILRRAREEAGLTQPKLAALLHTKQSVIARLESSRSNPTLETMERYAVATGASLEISLLFREAEKRRASGKR